MQTDLERREYAASTTEQGLQAPNRAHNLRTMFGERGIEVVPRTRPDTAPAWHFAWQTIGFGRPGQIEEVSPSSPSAAGARVVYERDGWSEWYENTAKGLEQGFTIERKPAGEGPLRIVGDFPAALRAEVREDGAIDFIDSHGACAIRYGELHAWDVQGVALSSELVVAGTELAIVIDDRDAEYPLTIDPLMTSPAWTAESNQTNAVFGFSVATAGDVNGDGFSDVIVGAWLYDNGQTDEGRAFVYHGSAAGLSFTPNWTAESDQAGAQFGYAVATAGDVNGDGFSDVMAGAWFFDNDETNEGRAFVYHGSASGVSPTPSWTAESDQASAQFGVSVATAEDVNADGFSDVIVGADYYDHGETDEGRAFVYHGSAGGVSPTPNWTAENNQAGAHFGSSVATAGDVNADRFSDVIVGAWAYTNGESNEGRAFVYHGSAGGLSLTSNWTAESNQASAFFGVSVAGAGDVNGDGFSDVIVGAKGFNNNGQSGQGRAFTYHGSAAGLAATFAWAAGSSQAAAFGHSVATAGDVNGDGFADVIVGAPNFTNGQSAEGRTFVYLGSAEHLDLSPIWTAESNQASANFGISVAAAGDVNGDGYSDVIVGAWGYDNGQTDEGRAFVYHGAASGIGVVFVELWSDQADARFSFSVATAGDVNGDGYSDVIVGAPAYDNGEFDEGRAFVYHGSGAGLSFTPNWTAESDQVLAEFGASVATAGDVNGDGFSDVIVGAWRYDNGQTDEGRAFFYYGSASGLSLTPNWTAESDQPGATFGNSVATAGDVNGDGFSDVIVGAWQYTNGEGNEGRAFAYHGSAAGLSTNTAWTTESNQVSAEFGTSVATAGDVNGDGFSDVIVGAYRYDNGQTNEGRAFVYHGSAAGLSTSPPWTAESNQIDAWFGNSVATAGDVNGDGFSDVIIGAKFYDNGETDEGCAFVYQGSAAGLAATPTFTAEPNTSATWFGHSVATAGDVNGDGFSDIVIGAPFYASGAVFPYHGSATGLIPALTLQINQPGAEFGRSVATAGDVNGDGFSDVIVGAPYYLENPFPDGRAFVYYGNEGASIARTPRQMRTDDSASISLLGMSDSPTSFLLKALGRTVAGRGQVRLQIEVKPFGVLFDGSGLVTGATFDTGAPAQGIGSAVPLTELVSGLTAETLYHWRLRIAADSPFFPRSPWLGMPGNAPNEADLRTADAVTAVEEISAPAARLLLLEPVRPNPLRAQGEITYTLPGAGRARLAVYDVAGRQVALLTDGAQEGGRHALRWDGRDAGGRALPAGVYLLRLETAGRETSQKIVIAR